MNRPFRSIDPATGKPLRDYAAHDAAEVRLRLQRAEAAAAGWAEAPVSARAETLRRAAAILRARSDEYATLMAREMGKPLPQGRAEAEKCAWACNWFADEAGRILQSRPTRSAPGTAALDGEISFAPLGCVLAIMPWNFPFWQLVRFAAPALVAGNAVLLKHAENVPGCADALESLWEEAGTPRGVFQNLRVEVDRVPGVIQDPIVRAVTFTGSTRGGRAVAACAGAALKKTVLELGGSDPYVILEDADVAMAARTCVAARMVNGGQTCVAAKRLIVVNPVREEFTEHVVAGMKALRLGAPEGVPAPDLGPLARADLRDALQDQVDRSVADGARLLLGGAIPTGPGFFYPPTVLTDVSPGTAAFREETFGPVAAIVPAADEEAAIQLANDSTFGLGAAVFTRDRKRGEHIAHQRLQAGSCTVNDFVRSDPRLPFGGIKDSGWGRELSEFGLLEFVNVKSVVVGGGRP